MMDCSSSSRTIGRVWSSETRPKTLLVQFPVARSRTRSMISGAEEIVIEVLVAANTRPLPSAWRDFRLIWSSALAGPCSAVRLASQVVSGSPSTWTAKYIAESF